MKYEKFDILKKAKYSIVPNNRELYVVYVECDANDGEILLNLIKNRLKKTNFSYWFYHMLVSIPEDFLRKDGTLQDMGTM